MARSPTAVVRDAFDALNRRDLERLGSLLAEDAVEDVVPAGVHDGRDAVLAAHARVLAAVPDLRADLVHVATTGETVLATWEAAGTFTGAPLDGIEPTGERIRLQGAATFTVRARRVAGVQLIYDGAACARQVGLLPPRGSAEHAAMVAELNSRTAHRIGEGRLTAEQLGDLLGQEDMAVIATDVDGTVTQWNAAAERLYGWARGEVLGRPITALTVGPEDLDVAKAIMDAVRREGRWEGEFWVHGRDGTRFLVHVREALLADDRGQPLGLVGVSVPVPAQPRCGSA
jgi:uncharacterized protein (TIGR02246 family)